MQGDLPISSLSIKYLMFCMISNKEQSYKRSSWILSLSTSWEGGVKKKEMLSLVSAWTPTPEKSAINQTSFAASLCSATSPSQPDTLFKSAATIKPWMINPAILPYPSCCDLCWSCLFTACAASAQSHVNGTCLCLSSRSKVPQGCSRAA